MEHNILLKVGMVHGVLDVSALYPHTYTRAKYISDTQTQYFIYASVLCLLHRFPSSHHKDTVHGALKLPETQASLVSHFLFDGAHIR